ncbi:MAG: type II toxin-antitoxin system PemK/MazF family toxin [Isosphaeraceae bacterium]
MNPKPGEVWMADLGFAAKFRPVVIVSRQDPNPPRALIIYVPITTQDRGSPYEVVLPKTRFLQEGSVANVQGIASLPTVRLGRKIGALTAETLTEIKNAIAWALEIDLSDGPP